MHRRLGQLAALAAVALLAAAAAASARPAGEERILFERRSGTGVGDLYSVRPDGTGLRRLTTGGKAFGPAASPDGTRIAFSSDRGRGSGPLELYVMDAAGRNAKRLTRGLMSARGWDASYDAAWSPDGSRLVFARLSVRGSTSVEELYVVGADGTGLRRLTATPRAAERSPSWSPDGSTIAYERDGALWTMRPDGTGARRLAARGAAPAFSPDGTTIAFADPRGWIAKVGADGRSRRTVVRGHGAPAWSADGAHLVVTRADGLRLVRADGTGLRRLTRPPELRHDLEPSWQPAG
jgi:TolB protein